MTEDRAREAKGTGGAGSDRREDGFESGKPRILAFCCDSSAYPAWSEALRERDRDRGSGSGGHPGAGSADAGSEGGAVSGDAAGTPGTGASGSGTDRAPGAGADGVAGGPDGPGAEMGAEASAEWESAGGAELQVVRVPCAGKVEEQHILRALEEGADGVLVLGCFEDSCQYIRGNIRARERTRRVSEMLEEIGLGPERVAFSPLAANSADRFAEAVEDFVRRIAEQGPNPAGKEAVER